MGAFLFVCSFVLILISFLFIIIAFVGEGIKEDLNTQYMAENHLYFKKAELIENVYDGDWMIDEDYIIDNEDEF